MSGTELRNDLAIISDWIRPGARVLDLGCGDGTLLAHLAKQREVTGYGLERDTANISACIAQGVNVIQRDLDDGLDDFDDHSFDYVVMTQALQVVQDPQAVLSEMLRVGQQGIVTFPNFGHWSTRMHLGLRGRMPRTAALPSAWYNTENIHLCTLKDFEALCAEQAWKVLRRTVTDARHQNALRIRLLPNLTAQIGVYMLQRGRG